MKLTKLIFVSVLFTSLIMVSCGKNTEPDRFKKIVSDSSWRIGRAQVGTQNKTSDFNNYVFRFKYGKDIEVIHELDTVLGTWNHGNAKKPLLFYMNFSQQVPSKFFTLDDDWVVVYLTKDEFRLERNDSSEDEIIFRKKV
ncbi:MAG TPA: hypothetical protein PLP27_03440 [Crocinitomicaceae bacterium]|nr:hypothetical protein [Crocinitomicaceae bacterium]